MTLLLLLLGGCAVAGTLAQSVREAEEAAWPPVAAAAADAAALRAVLRALNCADEQCDARCNTTVRCAARESGRSEQC